MAELVTPIPTADLVDTYGDALQSISVQFRRFGTINRFAGPVVTVHCFEDNALLNATLTDHEDPVGRVLVIDGSASLRTALIGDLIAGIAVDRGWAGLVVNGAIRDSVAIDTLPIGVKALGTNPRKSGKTGAGQVNIPVVIDRVIIRPDQILHSDEDGIVALPAATTRW